MTKDDAAGACREALDAVLLTDTVSAFTTAKARLAIALREFRDACRAEATLSDGRTRSYTIESVELIESYATTSGHQESTVWRFDKPATVLGWQRVAHGLAAIMTGQGTPLAAEWLAGKLKWRRATVGRDGAATIVIDLPRPIEAWGAHWGHPETRYHLMASIAVTEG